jgi:hypothetical protein
MLASATHGCSPNCIFSNFDFIECREIFPQKLNALLWRLWQQVISQLFAWGAWFATQQRDVSDAIGQTIQSFLGRPPCGRL